jgi:ABC-type maltose transport system permease subunit
MFQHYVRVLQPTLKGYIKTHPFHCVEEFAAIDGSSEMYIFIMAVF